MFKRAKAREGREIEKHIVLPRLRKSADNLDKEHYWETDKAHHSLNKIANDIEKARLIRLKEPTGFLKCPITDFFLSKKTRDYDYGKNKK